ncbi:hypothetical protein CR513_30441, partial [Mucuna pruriens]
MDRAKEAIQKAFNDNEDNNPNIEMDCEVSEDLNKCIDRLNENDKFVDHIHNELPIYKRAGACRDASALHECYECNLIDPIALKDIDDSNE